MTEPKFTRWQVVEKLCVGGFGPCVDDEHGAQVACIGSYVEDAAAKARLIAAAPQMYHSGVDLVAALEEALAALNGAPNTQGLHSQIEAALRVGKAVISAAVGEG